MHRAGTSLAARILGLLGMDLGPDDAMMPASEDNPRGYWELQAAADLDEELLEHFAGRWHRLPGLVEAWELDRDLQPLRDRATRLLDEVFGESDGIVGFKDPRLSVVQPFWRAVTDVHATVTPIRRPSEVVGSLVKRDVMSPVKAAGLWLDHVCGAIAHDPDTHWVAFDDLLADPVAAASAMAEHVGLAAPSGDVAEQIESFRDRDLQRNADFEAATSGELATANALYGLLTSATDETTRRTAVDLATQLWHDRNETRIYRDRHRDSREQLGVLQAQVERLEPFEPRALQAEHDLRRVTAESQHWQRTHARIKDEYDRVMARKVVQVALRSAEAVKPAVAKVRELRGSPQASPDATDRTPGSSGPAHVPATEAAAQELRRRLVEATPAVDLPGDAPHVTVAVLTRDGLHHLRRCLPALASTAYPNLDLVVVDNGSSDGTGAYLETFASDAPFEVTVIRNEDNATFSAGNNQAIRATATGRSGDDLVLLLNNDIEPVEPSWLAHLVHTLRDHDAAAVGTRLIYPRRPDLDNQGDLAFDDLTLQHRGIAFEGPFDGVPRGRNLGAGEDPLADDATRVGPAAAATAACLLVRRDHLDRVGGLTEDYVYGTEDVELCLKLRAAGGTIAYDGQVALWHHEYGTQNAEGRDAKRHNRIHNRRVFTDTWGPRLFREVFLDKLDGRRDFSTEPLHVAIALTRDDESAGHGDWYTAHAFGDALESELGWRVSYAERFKDRWYDLDPSVDVLVAMIDAIDLTRVPSHVVTCAWVRNWPQRWIGHDWLDEYDLVFASSRALADEIEAHSVHTCLPLALAADDTRFRPDAGSGEDRADVLFVGSRHDKERDVEHAFGGLARRLRLELRGHGWEEQPKTAGLTAGPIPHADLPAAYADVPIVVDDTVGEATLRFGAVNSRVFEAIAAGALVITDNPHGCAELFDTPVPSWSTPTELVDEAGRWLADPDGRRERAAALRDELLAKHTYRHRAQEFASALRDWVTAPRVTILIGVPERAQVHQWGDYHFARDVQRSLVRAGHPTRVALLPDWEEAWISQSDVTLHLFGLSEYRPRSGQVNVLWNISHPELVTDELARAYDLVCVASTGFSQTLAARIGSEVHPLLQATDPTRMQPTPNGPEHELLFVGNSRRVRRRVVDDVLTAGLADRLSVYGADWTPDLVDPGCVRGDHVPNDELSAWYSCAAIVLNDHWDDMREHGFLSNRLFDAAACGAFVLSDHVDGIEDVFEGTVETYRDAADLGETARRWLVDPEGREARGAAARELVLARHTFDARVAELLDLVRPLLAGRPSRVLPVEVA